MAVLSIVSFISSSTVSIVTYLTLYNPSSIFKSSLSLLLEILIKPSNDLSFKSLILPLIDVLFTWIAPMILAISFLAVLSLVLNGFPFTVKISNSLVCPGLMLIIIYYI